MARNFVLKTGLFLLVLAMLAYTAAAANVSVCQNINVSDFYELNQSINSTGTCINIFVSNVTLDCKGFMISYGLAGGDRQPGVNVTNTTTLLTNITIQNCNIKDINASGTNGHVIRFANVNNSVIFNNTLQSNGSTTNRGISLETTGSVNITDNIIMTKGTGSSNLGIRAAGTTRANISNNVISTMGSSANRGIGVESTSPANTIHNNTITTQGTSSSNFGIRLTDGDRNNVTYNIINTNGTNSNDGILVNTDFNNIVSNIIQTNSPTGDTNDGIDLSSVANSNIIANNTITTQGDDDNRGIFIQQSLNNRITGNVITTIGTTSSSDSNFGIELFLNSDSNFFRDNIITTREFSGGANFDHHAISIIFSSHNLFVNNSVNATGALPNSKDYNTESTGVNNTVKDLLLARNGIRVDIKAIDSALKAVTASEASGLGVPTGNTSLNKFVNLTSNAGSPQMFLNVSYTALDVALFVESTLRLFRHDGTIWNDTGFFDTSGVDTTNNKVFANVTTFSTYGVFGFSTTDISSCQNLIIGASYTLIQNVTGTGTCFNITASDVNLDCQGFTVTYASAGGAGVGFDVLGGISNVTISDCNIRDGNASGTGGFGIRFSSTNQSTISSNNITTNGTSDNQGIVLVSSSGNSITSNTITTPSTGNGHGILLQTSSSNNIISSNTITVANSASQEWRSESSSSNNTVSRLTLGRTSSIIDLISFGGSAVKGVTPSEASGLGSPLARTSLDQFFNITQTESGSHLFFNATYAENSALDESTFLIYRNNGTGWLSSGFASPSGVDTVNNIAFANISNFSTYGVFGGAAAAPQNAGGRAGGRGARPYYGAAIHPRTSAQVTQTATGQVVPAAYDTSRRGLGGGRAINQTNATNETAPQVPKVTLDNPELPEELSSANSVPVSNSESTTSLMQTLDAEADPIAKFMGSSTLVLLAASIMFLVIRPDPFSRRRRR